VRPSRLANAVIERLAPWVEGVAVSRPVAAAAAPTQLTYTAPRPEAPALSDTTPIFVPPAVEDPSQVESPSQLSLGTQPVGLASQETLPMFSLEPWNANLSPSVKVLITVGMITALGTILAVVIGLIFSAGSGG